MKRRLKAGKAPRVKKRNHEDIETKSSKNGKIRNSGDTGASPTSV